MKCARSDRCGRRGIDLASARLHRRQCPHPGCPRSQSRQANHPCSVALPDDSNPTAGYTLGMKVAVSIPDQLFERVERFRQQQGRSRSKVVSAALDEYIARHASDEVTEAMNRVCANINTEPDDLIRTLGRRALERSEW